jgi:hypothetical protein
MPIDHVKAHDEHLAERWLLGEIPEAEAEEFEKHFFECPECAAAVEAGQILLANGKAVAAECQPDSEPSPSPLQRVVAWWRNPVVLVPLAASLLLGALSVYQSAVVIPGLRAPRVLPAFQLITASRGDAMQITIPRDAAWFAIAADIPPDAQFSQYVCELISDGRTLFQLPAAAPASGQPITILVPTRNVQAGPVQLTIFGAGSEGQRRDKVSTFSFELRYRR